MSSAGPSVGGHDEPPGDHTSADAADPPAASPLTAAAPGSAPAAAGRHAAAGMSTSAVGKGYWCEIDR